MSTDMAISLAKKFIRQISQPFDHTQTGISLWTLDDIEDKQRKDREEAERAIDIIAPELAPLSAQPEDVEMEYGGVDDELLANISIPAQA